MKKEKCSHKCTYRKRGPGTRRVLVHDIKDDGSRTIVEKDAKIVWEICVKCRREKEVEFRKGV